MDQVKEILKKAVQYRFWIAVGIAMLLPIIAYFVGTGSIRAETAKKEGEIKSAKTDADKYRSGIFPTPEYKTLTEERTAVLTKEVNEAWRKLYDRQAHLLDWPDEVEESFKAWGKKWPEDVDPSVVVETIGIYTQVYPREVTRVYESFRPFDYEEGDGIVVAPMEQVLLRPAGFNMAQPPSYGKVWAAQQRLWIQGVVLDVINRVNADAKDWDSAPLKQITGLEVANPNAQDQRSAAKGETLELAPEILRPGEESTETAATGGDGPADQAGMMGMMGMMGRGMGSEAYGGSGGMGMGGANSAAPEEVYFLKTEKSSPAFETAPVYVAVLIDQNRILDLFRAFRDSPFSIQVVDFEMSRPTARVKKPEKGETNPGFGYMGMNETLLGGMAMGMGMGMGSDAYGYGMGGMGMGMGMSMRGMGMEGYAGYGMGGATAAKKKGTDITAAQIKKAEEKAKAKKGEDEKAEQKADRPTTADPYFNVVEVRIYGQARFYNPPEPETPEEAPDSAGNTPEGETEAAPPAEGPAQAEAPAETPEAPPAPADEPAKTEPAQADESPKAEEPPPAEEAPQVKVGEPAQPEAADEPK